MYEILLERNAERDLKKLPKEVFYRIVLSVRSLAENPTTRDSEDCRFGE